MKFNWKTIKWLILAGLIPPLYFQLKIFIELDLIKMKTTGDFLFWTGASVGLTVFLSLIVFQEIKWLEKVLPWKKFTGWRILAEFLMTNATVLSAMYAFSFLSYNKQCNFHGANLEFKEHLFQELTMGVVLLTILLSIIEGSYFFNEWKKSLLESERLKKESLQAQLESLKNQVNPHFLFNSLNVLSNLVHIDANRAEEFIDQFASVYRYVLNIQDKMAVTLREELDFLNSYIFLQKIRFQDGFDVNIEIAPECEGHFVVPLSLQMMVENAIKHNVVDKDEPLLVKIHLEEDKIIVENRINLRSDENKSVGMGLKNLRQRYFLMAGIMPEFNNIDGEFVVNIPLLKPEKEESNNEENACCYHRRRKLRS